VSRRVILVGRLIGLFQALAAAQALGFGAAGVVIFSQSGDEGLGGFVVLVLSALALTAVFLSLAALVAAGAPGRRRARSLAVGLVVWFVSFVLVDAVSLGVASLLPSGAASRVLILTVLADPLDAIRTLSLLGIEGTAGFGSASLALLRFTHGMAGAVAALVSSTLLWTALPFLYATRRLEKTDL
jgi:Cu-processing system permease protein